MIFKGYTLSKEQLQAMQLYTQLGVNAPLVIDAGAGASKTFTCNAIVSSLCANEKVLVLAFNSIIVEEMRDAFPSDVTVETTHSLARSKTKPYRNDKLHAPLTSRVISNALELPKRVLGLSQYDFSSTLLKLVNSYCVSDVDLFSDFVNKNAHSFNVVPNSDFSTALIEYGSLLWEKMTDRSSPCPVTHDVYLKEFVLLVKSGGIKLDYDVVVLDEAQDTVPIVKQLVELLQAKTIIVGDKFQSIYEWRNAVNVMQTYMNSGATVTRLTTCYRFGDDIAQLSNRLIKEYYGEDPKFVGNPNKKSHIYCSANHEPTERSLMLFRTNAELMASLVEKVDSGERCCLLKNKKESISLIDDAEKLYKGQRVARGIMSAFETWYEFEQYVKSDSGSELKTFFKTVETYGFKKMRSIILTTTNTDAEKATYVFATAHSTKGIEFDHVVIAGDFDTHIERAQGRVKHQEINLLYVALTRAVKSLDISQCSTLLRLSKQKVVNVLAQSKMEQKRAAAEEWFS